MEEDRRINALAMPHQRQVLLFHHLHCLKMSKLMIMMNVLSACNILGRMFLYHVVIFVFVKNVLKHQGAIRDLQHVLFVEWNLKS